MEDGYVRHESGARAAAGPGSDRTISAGAVPGPEPQKFASDLRVREHHKVATPAPDESASWRTRAPGPIIVAASHAKASFVVQSQAWRADQHHRFCAPGVSDKPGSRTLQSWSKADVCRV